ncbi:BLUF domain-containing protein (plasmid) [Roseomonas sp. CCTCC AB2023176]|uniref:BLUF domain-containing protein n=1 Tax=Roseomonas sp. CCTCC AB2023176 TaxID=3342640 RepID=UPI0035DC8424
MVYRSRAVRPVSGVELAGLMQAAQARNRREAISGVLLYDESHFFQWLEGPADGVDRVMRSIRGDPRHTDIEILADGPAPERRFEGWDMRLAMRRMSRSSPVSDVLEPAAEIIEGLRRHPERAAGLLLRLVEVPGRAIPPFGLLDRHPSRAMMTRRIEAVLRSTFRDVVVSQLADRRGTGDAGRRGMPSPRTSELAELLISDDEGASLQLIRELRGEGGVLDGLYAPLFEPAARRLGDLWADDECGELEVALGLARLGTAARLLGTDAPRYPSRGIRRNVLVVPAPGEVHQLVAGLDFEWLWSRGWAPQQDFPANDQALEDLVSGTWIDVLDLSLSAAFRRGDRLRDLSRSIALARRASRNAALLVVVGGRVFAENPIKGREVGADLASPTSQDLDRRLLADSMSQAGAKVHALGTEYDLRATPPEFRARMVQSG